MTDRGRHARRSGFGFYKDALILVAGILIVGAVVFGGLSLWAGSGEEPDPPATSAGPTSRATTTSTAPDATAGPITTATTATTATTTAATVAPSTTATSAPPTTLRPPRVPADVRVVVLNSIGVTGLAADLTAELGELGYQIATPANYSPELSDTMIFHAEGFSLEALEIVEVVPDGTVAPNSELAGEWDVDVVVVLGRSYQE